jgi:hypothetical protein
MTDATFTPPSVAGHQLPSLTMLAYLEKLSVVVLAAVVILYLIARSFHASPAVAMREVSGLR